MFEPSVYAARREALAASLPGSLILLPGNEQSPVDFHANAYPFRQDGSFRYFFGLDHPGWTGLIDAADGTHRLFVDNPGSEDYIWTGPCLSRSEQAATAGVALTGTRADLEAMVCCARSQGRLVHYPAPYRGETTLFLSRLLARETASIPSGASTELALAVIALREIKTSEEIAELTSALAVTRDMHHLAMRTTVPGRREHEIVGRVEGIARGAGLRLSYQPVFTARGEILHNTRYDAALRPGDLVVHDAGVVSPRGYATDITRTLPVSGRFDPLQRRLYETVLRAQDLAISLCRPGTRFRDVHMAAAQVLVEGLSELGVFRGDPAAVVGSGAYALLFQCGLGHQIGLDVHDMEALGEELVGYDRETPRRPEFGLRNLRMGKRLKAGMVVTVEPGLYFIPRLIAHWRAEGAHADLINYDRLDELGFVGGIRVEDDLLITDEGAKVLGEPIARTVEEVENMMGERGATS